MCVGHIRRDEEKDKRDEPPREPNGPRAQPQDYSQMFREVEMRLEQYRALLMRRLVQDPFYHLMNISPASRIWMLRYLKHLALYAEQRHHVNLLEFFERMTREEVFAFFRLKNAPVEMVELWAHLHPATEPAAPTGLNQPS